jgi:hypothetical protein
MSHLEIKNPAALAEGFLFYTELDQALVEHGIHHLHEAGDVGADHVVAGVPYCSAVSIGFVDADHNLLQALVHFLPRPVDVHAVLGHLKARNRYAAGVGGLARAVEHLVLDEDIHGLRVVGMLAPSETT